MAGGCRYDGESHPTRHDCLTNRALVSAPRQSLPASNGKAAGRAPTAAKKPHKGNPRPAYTGRGFVPAIYGGASRARTGDLLAASQTLSQLSYGP